MPRDILEISNFNSGIITSPDIKDIPKDAAIASTNIDSDVEDGKIAGIKKPTVFSASVGLNAKLGEFINNNGTYTLVYHDPTSNKIKAISDFYGTPSESDLVTSDVSDNCCIIGNNREVHIGTGNGALNYPKWVGFIDWGQFNGFNEKYFNGAGADDLTPGGTYTGNGINRYEVKIVASAPDRFQWRKNDGSWSGDIEITGVAQTLTDGIEITFGGILGHAVHDIWYIVYCVQPTGLQVDNAKLNSNAGFYITNDSFTVGVDPKPFVTTKIYDWGCSATYDGYQESDITWSNTGNTPVSNSASCTFRVEVTGFMTANPVSKRVTGVNVWRRERGANDANYGLATLVESIDINETWTRDNDDIYYEVTDTGNIGVTYEAYTGISETLEDEILNYALSCKSNNYHFIAKCLHGKIPDASNYIFRSKQGRFDKFNWSDDILILPNPPVAIASYENKVFAFNENHVYQIHSEGFFIEQELPGIGAKDQRSVLSTPFGLFAANGNNLYQITTDGYKNISLPIKNSSNGNVSWETYNSSSYIPVLSFNSQKNILLCAMMKSSGEALKVWAYNVLKERWDYYSLTDISTTYNYGIITGKDGETYISNGTNLYKLFNDTVRYNWDWIGKEQNFGNLQKKSIVGYRIDKYVPASNATLTVYYSLDGGSNFSSVSESNGVYTIKQYYKSVVPKLVTSGTSGGDIEINQLEIMYRELIGAR